MLDIKDVNRLAELIISPCVFVALPLGYSWTHSIRNYDHGPNQQIITTYSRA